MKAYTVYRSYYLRQISEPVGKLVERRSEDRGNNKLGLLRLAKKLYSTPSPDAHVVITLG